MHRPMLESAFSGPRSRPCETFCVSEGLPEASRRQIRNLRDPCLLGTFELTQAGPREFGFGHRGLHSARFFALIPNLTTAGLGKAFRHAKTLARTQSGPTEGRMDHRQMHSARFFVLNLNSTAVGPGKAFRHAESLARTQTGSTEGRFDHRPMHPARFFALGLNPRPKE